jgi:Tol biopolymer transport system component
MPRVLRPSRLTAAVLVIPLLSAVPLLSAAPPAAGHGGHHDDVRRVSIATGGAQGDRLSWRGTISGDGRWVAFTSEATTLVAGDTNGVEDVFVHDTRAGSTRRISAGPAGEQADSWSSSPAISGDGRYVAFESDASNLVPSDTNGTIDVFVHDIWTGTTQRVSLGPGGRELTDFSGSPALSPEGRYVAFTSYASDVVPGDTNGVGDVFVRELASGATRRVSVSTGGTQGSDHSGGPSVSADGASVAFNSQAPDLVPGDTNGVNDIFVHDVATGRTERVSIATDGTQGSQLSGMVSAGGISADGTRIAFHSFAPELAPGDTNGALDGFVRDRRTGRTILVSQSLTGGPGRTFSFVPRISPDGRYAAFDSLASDLVAGDTNGTSDVFVRDLKKGTTRLVTRNRQGALGNGYSSALGISAHGKRVVFTSEASNLVTGDTNGVWDVFVTDAPHH